MKKIFVLLFCFIAAFSSIAGTPIGYLLWGTRFLYHPHQFPVNPADASTNAPKFQSRHGFRGDDYIANLNQTVVETNHKLFDVEDSTRSYKSPLSHW